MAAFATPAPPVIAVESLEHPLEIEEVFILNVLGETGDHLVSGRAIKLIGRKLIAQVSEWLQPGAGIRIDCDDAFMLGEVLGGWREEDAIFAALDLQQGVTRLAEWAAPREESWGEPRRLELHLRRSA